MKDTHVAIDVEQFGPPILSDGHSVLQFVRFDSPSALNPILQIPDMPERHIEETARSVNLNI
jgi:hypothetical protein